VRAGGEAGITFLAEWLLSWTEAQLGPWLYGLPYRRGGARIGPGGGGGWVGCVSERGREGRFHYRLSGGIRLSGGRETDQASFQPAEAGSFTEFPLERHTCFLRGTGCGRRFRVWLEPWQQRPAEAAVLDDSLLRETAPRWLNTRFLGAHMTPAARDVWKGRSFRL
jgi:hypothetical protein